MARFEVVLRASAARELEGIPSREDRRKVVARIGALAANPRPTGCVKLSGQEKYRIRQGRFRILYEIQDARLIVTVVKVADRKEAYR